MARPLIYNGAQPEKLLTASPRNPVGAMKLSSILFVQPNKKSSEESTSLEVNCFSATNS